MDIACMVSVFKKIVRKSPFYPRLYEIRSRFQYRNWLKSGRPDPPPHIVKQQNIKRIAEHYDLHVFVETGTFLGSMVRAVRDTFEEIYSIELNKALFEKAKRRFRNYPHIHLFQGDSGRVLSEVVCQIRKPALFWLDSHYSGGITAQGEQETPIYQELVHVFGSPQLGHVVLIDDARCFNGTNGYPTITDVLRFVTTQRPNAVSSVRDDCIQIVT